MAIYDDSNEVCCSFCGKPHSQVRRLIAGPDIYICDECVELCNEILDEEFFDSKEKEGVEEAKSNKDEKPIPKPHEIKAYLDWAQPKLDSGIPENQLALFSTLNLHIFQTYYGGLRQSADKSQWIYGNVELVKQFIEGAQGLKEWLEAMGSEFHEDTQPTLIGALWYRENEFVGAKVDTDGNGTYEAGQIGGVREG